MTRYNRKFFEISKVNEKTIQKFADYRLNTCKKSENTVKQNVQMLRSFANFLKEKPFKESTKDDLMGFFGDPNTTSSINTRDIYGTTLILFYRWLFDLKRRIRPDIMEWFEYTTVRERDRLHDPNQKEKYFITREEYEQIIDECITVNGHDQALFQTLYVSGGRPHEVTNMKIKDVEETEGHVTVTFNKSKTKPRKVPLSGSVEHLMRWLGNHPFRDDPEASLWLTFSRQSRLQPMQVYSIATKLEDIKKRTDLKKTVTPHTFRKTRATIMFAKRYDDKEMGQLFGWSPQTVVKRRQEYDLRGFDDLKKKVFAKPVKSASYDVLKRQKERLEYKHQKELDTMKQEMDCLRKQMVEVQELLTEDWKKLQDTGGR